MFQYYCDECGVFEFSCEIEPKKLCPGGCGYLLFVTEIEAIPTEEMGRIERV